MEHMQRGAGRGPRPGWETCAVPSCPLGPASASMAWLAVALSVELRPSLMFTPSLLGWRSVTTGNSSMKAQRWVSSPMERASDDSPSRCRQTINGDQAQENDEYTLA